MKRVGDDNIIRELVDALDRHDDATVIRILRMALTPEEAKRILAGDIQPCAAAGEKD